MRKAGIALVLAVVILSMTDCATHPKKIEATYVSPMTYQHLDCDQCIAEMDRVNRRIGELYMSLKKTADRDSAQMGIGMILFWPALFGLEGGDGPEATEYARLKGEREALETAALEKKCDSRYFPPSVEETVAEQERIAKEEKDRLKEEEKENEH